MKARTKQTARKSNPNPARWEVAAAWDRARRRSPPSTPPWEKTRQLRALAAEYDLNTTPPPKEADSRLADLMDEFHISPYGRRRRSPPKRRSLSPPKRKRKHSATQLRKRYANPAWLPSAYALVVNPPPGVS